MDTSNDIQRATLVPPAALADVSLIDAEAAAAAGAMSVSWWHEEVRAGRAPLPAVQRPRCTRWRLIDVREFWKRFAETGATDAGMDMRSRLSRASLRAREMRAAKVEA
jgi:hypothetical protein